MINPDNGPENSGTRTQWLRRLLEFAAHHRVDAQLACYPPYHSKYNPIERVFGVLENYWITPKGWVSNCYPYHPTARIRT